MGSKLDGNDENAGTAVQVESSSICSTKETLPPQPAAPHKISLSTYLAIISFWFHYAAANVAIVMISAVIANINQDIGPSPVYTWLASSLALASSISVGVAGTVTDLTGRRGYSILFGLVGIVGCIVAVTSKNISQLIGANVLVGLYIGSSENSLSAVSELVTHNQRGAVMACFNAGIGVFTVFGSLIAHAMVRNGSWRSIYYLVIALDVAGTVALFFLYHPQAPLAGFSSYRSLVRGFDWFGLLGLMTGPTLLLLAITWLGGTYPISDVRVLTTLIIGIVAIALLGVYEAFVPENPLLHPHLFRRIRTFTLILIVTIVGGMLYYSLLSFFPLYLSLIYVNDPSDDIKIGVYNIPLQAGSLFGGVTTFWALPKLRKPRPMLIIAVFVQLLFIALMAIPSK
ncbi:putative major facilitator superfamily transporter [Fonsecaea pedrosoi]|nr:putative major facilitator superfamily transporter [Fonsecaea pedrosoi]